MAKKKQSVPEYGTVTSKGTLYYRTELQMPMESRSAYMRPPAKNYMKSS